MFTDTFSDVIASEAELRAVIGEASPAVIRKQMPKLDQHCRTFIARSPFLTIGTANASGAYDVSPRGDLPGFALILDDNTLVIPERPGNRRIDTLCNIMANPNVGLLFFIPGVDETLRVNGRACIVRDAALLERMEVQGKRPLVGIAVEVREAFLHCAKAFRRSKLWRPAEWPDRAGVPTLGQMIKDQLQIDGVSAEAIDCDLEEGYAKSMY